MIWVQCFLIEDLSDICIQYHWRRCQRSQISLFGFFQYLYLYVSNICKKCYWHRCGRRLPSTEVDYWKNFCEEFLATTTKNYNYEKLQLRKTTTSKNCNFRQTFIVVKRTLVTHNDNINNHKKIATTFWCFWGIHAAKITNNKTWQYLNIYEWSRWKGCS